MKTENISKKEVDKRMLMDFINECAILFKKLYGYETPLDTLSEITDILYKHAPLIYKNKDFILTSIAIEDLQYRSPKILMLKDFNLTPEKINAIKNIGMKVFTEEEVSRILKNFNNKKIRELEEKIEKLENELRIEEFNWKNFPEEKTKLGYQDIMDFLNDEMDKNTKLSEENDKLKMIIRRLEQRFENKKFENISLKSEPPLTVENYKVVENT
ncbi:MAG: hypothetical protein EPN82_02445 [Bacteroidetes bacterium]|nr:MAG: hypothetical protein EPN82_02445 [Bacteroidota bacterium]